MSKKSRKLIRQGLPDAAAPQGHQDSPQPTDGLVESRSWSFFFLPPAETHPVDEKALHELMKDWRHGRASRKLSQVLGDAYYMIFSIVLIGAMVVNLVLESQQGAAGCTSLTCRAGRELLPWALLLGVATLTLTVSRIFGPVMASAAEGSWLMDAPVSRTRLLGGRLSAALVLPLVASAPLAALITALSGLPSVQVVGWALATGVTASALIAFAALEQTFERSLPVRVLQAVLAALAGVVVVVMVLVASGRMPLSLPGWVAQAPWAVAAVAAAAAAVFALVARRRLGEIRRARLLSGGSLVSGMQGAMFALDLGLARDILVERDAVARGFVRPTKGRGRGPSALVWRDVQRVTRFPKPLVGLVAAALVPYAADALGLGFLMPLLAALGLVAAMIPFLGSLRVLSRTGGLARALPFSTRQIRNATMVVPAGLAVAWALVAFPAVLGVTGGPTRSLPDGVLVTLAIAAAGLLGAMRWQTAKQVDYGKPMMATNAGGIQPTLIFNLFRGIDVAVAVCAPILLGGPPWLAFAIAGIIYLLLRSGANLEEIQEEAKEQQALLDAEKRGRSEKVKIPRPTR